MEIPEKIVINGVPIWTCLLADCLTDIKGIDIAKAYEIIETLIAPEWAEE